jgi:hypothetical protein
VERLSVRSDFRAKVAGKVIFFLLGAVNVEVPIAGQRDLVEELQKNMSLFTELN